MFSGSIEPIDIDVAAIINEELSPAAKARALAVVARSELAAAEKTNSSALGFLPTHTTTVDGAAGVSEDAVRPDGTIVYAFDLLPDVFSWIAEQLQMFAPVLSGRFKDSFEFFIDGVLAALTADMPPASEFVFLSSAAYAGKIEGEEGPPESRQAPNGVFEAVATIAQMKFPQVKISFSYRVPFPDAKSTSKDTPAITITLGS
jgi:hypothetical protein